MSRTKTADRRRQEILEAAAAVIAERGLCDTRIADVAARVGASPGLVIYYFPTKERLLAEALGHEDQGFVDRVTALLDGASDAPAKLRVMIEASCPGPAAEGGSPTDRDWVLWLDLWARARLDPELADERSRLDRVWREAIADVVRQGQETGEFGPADPDRVALHLSALIDGLAIQVMLGDGEVTRAVMRDMCLDVAGEQLGVALRPRETSKKSR
ncbi:MAG TPA: TetR/AcrR family transcriptional regulator [Acidimicrobiia bacterium]|jgi:AcrR family transcriptional regulator